MRKTGIYKITNLTNGKYYIGQSRDIYTRWKAHTLSITETSDESVIRMAFAKYGLRKQVNTIGNHENFSFEIIELCDESKLLERETFYIQQLKPAYNVQLMGTSSIFPKRDLQREKYFIQYHSLEKIGYIPGDSDDDTITTETSNYGIFTRKRLAINMIGANVILIFGAKPSNCTHNRYYLWSELIVEDIQYNDTDKTYLIQGIENVPNIPIDLTDITGFNEFRMQCGNFAYGLQAVKNKHFFFEKILPLMEQHKLKQAMSYNAWIDQFIEHVETRNPAKNHQR